MEEDMRMIKSTGANYVRLVHYPHHKRILDLAKENEIPVSTVFEVTATGTNNECVVFIREGIPTAVVSLPLAGMHSYNELISTEDAENFIRLIGKIITTADL